MPKYVFYSTRDDYMTPVNFVEKVLQENNLPFFDCDVCCTEFNIPAKSHYKKDGFYIFQNKVNDIDGLNGEWSKFNWCNPPFDKCEEFIAKAVTEQAKGNTTFMLIPARTETGYWQKYILNNGKANRKNIEVEFLRKGLCFIDPETGKPVQMNITKKNGTIVQVDGVYKNPLALITFKGVC